jgi:hypothetical protein
VKQQLNGHAGADGALSVASAEFVMPKSWLRLAGMSTVAALAIVAPKAIAAETPKPDGDAVDSTATLRSVAKRSIGRMVKAQAVSQPESIVVPMAVVRTPAAMPIPIAPQMVVAQAPEVMAQVPEVAERPEARPVTLVRDVQVISQAALLAEGDVAQVPVLPKPAGDGPEKAVTPENPGEPNPGKVSPVTRSNLSAPANMSANVESYYYNWNDKLGNRGNQVVMPLTVTYSQGNFDAGLRTAYIKSQFRGNLILDGTVIGKRQGDVSTLSDTSLSLAYTMKQSKFPVRFNLDVNLPTGKATLKGDEKNAIMDGALVQQTRFGEGFNLAPGISVSHAFSPNDVVGVGLSHIIRGKFDPNGDVVNDVINPGNETVATLQYQRSGKKSLLMGGLIYTHYGTTKRGDLDYYRTGSRLDLNLTGVFQVSTRSRLQLSGRYFTQGRNNVVNFFTGSLQKEQANSNGQALYLSADWGLGLDKQQRSTVHLLADYLGVKANSYDPINDLFNAGRNKLSIGVGYDYAFSRSTRASIQAKWFRVIDKATPVTQQDVKSNGISLFASLNYNF